MWSNLIQRERKFLSTSLLLLSLNMSIIRGQALLPKCHHPGDLNKQWVQKVTGICIPWTNISWVNFSKSCKKLCVAISLDWLVFGSFGDMTLNRHLCSVFMGPSQFHRLQHHTSLPSYCKSGTYLCNCYNFSKDNLKLQWSLWGNFDMNKIVHLTDTLERKEKNSHEEKFRPVCLIERLFCLMHKNPSLIFILLGLISTRF